MCRNIAQSRSIETLAELYGPLDVAPDTKLKHHEELAPGERLAFVHGHGTGRTLAATRWLYAGGWAGYSKPLRHARGETMTVKPTFRDAARNRRAIVPCEGWTERRTTPVPGPSSWWARRERANAPLHVAALSWGRPRAGRTCAVIVTAASAPSMAVIHHRQPLCLHDDEVDAWLDPSTPLAAILKIVEAAGAREPGAVLAPAARQAA